MLSTLLKRKAAPQPPAEINGVRVKHNPRARRLSLRTDARTGDIILVWPKRASVAAATRFITEQKDWIAHQRAQIVAAEKFLPGNTLFVNGRPLLLVSAATRGTARIEGDRLIVHGRPEFFHRRLTDFLKQEAFRVLNARTLAMTDQLQIKPSQVKIADPKSRWGSCGSDGRIMYSWRLILAPPEVIDYIVAHEVAHRIHMNHGIKFWRLCFSLCDNGASARRWLKTEGRHLARYR